MRPLVHEPISIFPTAPHTAHYVHDSALFDELCSTPFLALSINPKNEGKSTHSLSYFSSPLYFFPPLMYLFSTFSHPSRILQLSWLPSSFTWLTLARTCSLVRSLARSPSLRESPLYHDHMPPSIRRSPGQRDPCWRRSRPPLGSVRCRAPNRADVFPSWVYFSVFLGVIEFFVNLGFFWKWKEVDLERSKWLRIFGEKISWRSSEDQLQESVVIFNQCDSIVKRDCKDSSDNALARNDRSIVREWNSRSRVINAVKIKDYAVFWSRKKTLSG